MTDHPERTRLLKQDNAKLAEMLRGHLEPEFRVETGLTGAAVHVYKKKVLVASFRWVKDIGWQPFIVQPFVFCIDDAEHAADELERCVRGAEAIRKKWSVFLRAKSERTWKSYKGAHAAHYFRMYEPDVPPKRKRKKP